MFYIKEWNAFDGNAGHHSLLLQRLMLVLLSWNTLLKKELDCWQCVLKCLGWTHSLKLVSSELQLFLEQQKVTHVLQ